MRNTISVMNNFTESLAIVCPVHFWKMPLLLFPAESALTFLIGIWPCRCPLKMLIRYRWEPFHRKINKNNYFKRMPHINCKFEETYKKVQNEITASIILIPTVLQYTNFRENVKLFLIKSTFLNLLAFF